MSQLSTDVGMAQTETTRIWTAGFSRFHLPGFRFGVTLFSTAPPCVFPLLACFPARDVVLGFPGPTARFDRMFTLELSPSSGLGPSMARKTPERFRK